ncbi:MAG: sulfatase [Planctomycetota bacterium]
MKRTASTSVLAALLLTACRSPEETRHAPVAASGSRPNILFVYCDDHATAALGCYGASHAPTPAIDALAAQGLVFDRAYCANAICAPARATVLTGRYSRANGVTTNAEVFDPASSTFPKQLQAAGYETALFGKWHLKSDPTGFDTWEILPDQGSYYEPDLHGPDGDRRVHGHCTEVVTDLALDWLREERDPSKPFCLMVQHKAPHRAWRADSGDFDAVEEGSLPEPATLFDDWSGRSAAASSTTMTIANDLYLEYDLKVPLVDGEPANGPDRWAKSVDGRMDAEQRAAWDAFYGPANAAFRADTPRGDDLVRWKYQRFLADYLRCVAGVDRSVARLLAELDELGLADDTLVVYTSDQGFFLGEHGWYDKRFAYEPSMRFPLVVRWPGRVEPGTRDAHLVQNVDFAATFCDLAGVAAPDGAQGASLVPLLTGDPPVVWRDAVYFRYEEVGIHDVEPHRAVRTDRYKLLRFDRLGASELYDLRADPDELVNLAERTEYAPLRRSLEEELERLTADFEAGGR